MDGMDELRSPSLPTSPAAPIIVFPLPSMLSVLQLLGTIRCPEKPRAAHPRKPATKLLAAWHFASPSRAQQSVTKFRSHKHAGDVLLASNLNDFGRCIGGHHSKVFPPMAEQLAD